MRKKLTLTIDQNVYDALRTTVGPRKIARFIEDLVRPHVVTANLAEQYREMAADERAEREALGWADATIGDVADEAG